MWLSQRPAVGSSDWLGDLRCIRINVEREINLKLCEQSKRRMWKGITKVFVAKPADEELDSSASCADTLEKRCVLLQSGCGGMDERGTLSVLRHVVAMGPEGGNSRRCALRRKSQRVADDGSVDLRMPDAQ
jgi:hypothetical protein